MDQHICGVCNQPSWDHPEDCGEPLDAADGRPTPCRHFAALCCPGCQCLSFYEAHPYSDRITDEIRTLGIMVLVPTFRREAGWHSSHGVAYAHHLPRFGGRAGGGLAACSTNIMLGFTTELTPVAQVCKRGGCQAAMRTIQRRTLDGRL